MFKLILWWSIAVQNFVVIGSLTTKIEGGRTFIVTLFSAHRIACMRKYCIVYIRLNKSLNQECFHGNKKLYILVLLSSCFISVPSFTVFWLVVSEQHLIWVLNKYKSYLWRHSFCYKGAQMWSRTCRIFSLRFWKLICLEQKRMLTNGKEPSS